MSASRPVAVLYLDIDGTVRQGKDDALGRFVNGPEDVVVFPEAVERMRAWKDAGGRVVGVSNQGGVALGHMTMATAHDAMRETNRQADSLFDLILMCTHYPTAEDPDLRRCVCRKPRPGMVAQAIRALGEDNPAEFYPITRGLFVGDRHEDRECAAAADLDFQWAADWRAGRDLRVYAPDQIADPAWDA